MRSALREGGEDCVGHALEFALAFVEGEAHNCDGAAVVKVGRGVAAVLNLPEGLLGGGAIALELEDKDDIPALTTRSACLPEDCVGSTIGS